MPYRIEKRGDKHCVINKDNGNTEKCHSTRKAALQHMKALYVHVQGTEPSEFVRILCDEKWLSFRGTNDEWLELNDYSKESVFQVTFAERL